MQEILPLATKTAKPEQHCPSISQGSSEHDVATAIPVATVTKAQHAWSCIFVVYV